MHNKPHTAEARAKMALARRGKPAPWKHRETVVVDGVTLFRCGRCIGFMPRTAFHVSRRTMLGIKSEGKTCHGRSSVASRDPENTRRLRREAEARRRARKAGSSLAVSSADMAELERLWGAACLACAATTRLQWDHVVPLARGGAHCVSNLQRLCRSCNEKKQAREADYRSAEQAIWVVSFKRVESATRAA